LKKCKCRNGQIQVVGVSFAKVDPQEWKQHREEQEEGGGEEEEEEVLKPKSHTELNLHIFNETELFTTYTHSE
jgi:hypothetical protein